MKIVQLFNHEKNCVVELNVRQIYLVVKNFLALVDYIIHTISILLLKCQFSMQFFFIHSQLDNLNVLLIETIKMMFFMYINNRKHVHFAV